MVLYNVHTDTGVDPKKAWELYDEAMSEAELIPVDPNVEEGFIGRGRNYPIETGFYLDSYSDLGVCLFIQSSVLAAARNVLQVCPNSGKSLRDSKKVWE